MAIALRDNIDNTISKVVNSKELELYRLAEKDKLTPILISYDKIGEDEYCVTMARYSHTLHELIQYRDRNLLSDLILRVRDLLVKLHGIGIFHGDVSEENIVYDKSTDRVALIDFGLSRHISSIRSEEISSLIENYYEGLAYAGPIENNIEYLLRLELGVLDFLAA